jgi:hypothetical protein
MIVYIVTHKNLDKEQIGYYKGMGCYQMGFYEYWNSSDRGYVFSTAEQALNFMLKG